MLLKKEVVFLSMYLKKQKAHQSEDLDSSMEHSVIWILIQCNWYDIFEIVRQNFCKSTIFCWVWHEFSGLTRMDFSPKICKLTGKHPWFSRAFYVNSTLARSELIYCPFLQEHALIKTNGYSFCKRDQKPHSIQNKHIPIQHLSYFSTFKHSFGLDQHLLGLCFLSVSL